MDPSKYFKNQGVVITSDTRKRDLVSKVYHACRLDLPLCSTKNKTMPKSKRDKRKALYRRNLASSPARIGKLARTIRRQFDAQHLLLFGEY